MAPNSIIREKKEVSFESGLTVIVTEFRNGTTSVAMVPPQAMAHVVQRRRRLTANHENAR